MLPVKSFELGRMVIEGDRAEIETRVEMAGDTPMNLQLTTVLVRAGSVWRIDYEATVRDISRDSELAKILEQLRQLGARVGADLNRSIDELKNAIPKLESELSKIEKDIRAQVPELRKRLEELAKELRAPPPGSTTHRDYRRAI